MGLVKIQSISDIITNSSSEVFCIKATENFQKAFKGFENLFDAIFLTEEDIRKYLIESERWKIESDLDEVVDYNPLGSWDLWNYVDSTGRTKEETVDFFLPAYKDLLGYAILKKEDNYYCEKLNNYIKENRDKDGEEIRKYHT